MSAVKGSHRRYKANSLVTVYVAIRSHFIHWFDDMKRSFQDHVGPLTLFHHWLKTVINSAVKSDNLITPYRKKVIYNIHRLFYWCDFIILMYVSTNFQCKFLQTHWNISIVYIIVICHIWLSKYLYLSIYSPINMLSRNNMCAIML